MKHIILTVNLLLLFCISLTSCGVAAAGGPETAGHADSSATLHIEATRETQEVTEEVTAPPDTTASETQKLTPPPVIVGVKSSITVYEDDPASVLELALLEGVGTEGGEECEVRVRILPETSSLSAGQYDLLYYCDRADIMPVASLLTVKPADKEPPVISGASDMVVYIGDSISYRKGVSVSDNDDGGVKLSVDASRVDLTKAGTYSVTYSAADRRGNTASIEVLVTVVEPPENLITASSVCTAEEFDALCKKIISEIITPNMTDRQKARAIYDRVHSIKYVSTSVADNDPVSAAYIALTTGRGDCQNYAAASKALLSAAGIPNYDMERSGGKTRHYWNLVFIEGGWYHFDACPTPKSYPMELFLLTDEEAEAYTKLCRSISNYLTYDRTACPYEAVKKRT